MSMNTITMLLACVLSATETPTPQLLNSFEAPADIALLKTSQTKIEAVSTHVTAGKQALQVRFLQGEYPNVRMSADPPWNFTGLGALVMDMTNPGKSTLKVGVRIDDDPRADGTRFCAQAEATVEPGQSLSVAIPLAGAIDPMKYGVRGLPSPLPGVTALSVHATTPLNLAHVVEWQVFLHRPQLPAELILDNVRVVPWQPDLNKIVDEFGQYAKADWPGKVHSVDDFTRRRAEEQVDWKIHPGLPQRDRFGGWTGAPAQTGSGFFRTEKINGKWWLITPEGHLFFSAGMDCVTLSDATVITGRESMFAWLPEKGSRFAHHAGRAGEILRGPVRSGDTFNFLTCNLERKFGTDYATRYFDEALTRLTSWGFNTVGNWSDQQLYGNARVPYVATVHVGGDHHYISSGTDYWGKMHDPFDPKFRADAARNLSGLAARIKDDPWCVGWFVDNELSWGGWGDDDGRVGLGVGTLAEAGECHAKQALLAQFKKQYADIGPLNQAWETNFADWGALEPSFKTPAKLPTRMKADLNAFVKAYARQYFQVVKDELQKVDNHHLYLGCRFAWNTPEAVIAANEICDVVSFNIYQPRLDPEKYPAIKLVDKPCMIGEFHFGALDRGMFHTGLVQASNQKARAAMYVDYLRSVADHPNFVGCHWFQYVDEPLTGRSFDGENYEIGFVSVTDTPYPEMVEAARQVHAEIYPRRWK